MGLTALAMENTPWFPTYPDRMADADVSAGLVLPYAAVALLGKGGAVGTLLIVFMAVTSATSSQLIAVSTICTYDLYRTYFNPAASGKRLIYMSHAVVIGYGIFIATFSVGLWYAGVSMGYLYLMMGVIISAAVLPATLALIWYVSKPGSYSWMFRANSSIRAGQNKWAASLSPILGLACALIAWLVTAKRECGDLGVACTGSNNPMLAGNVAALLSPVVLVGIFTLIFGIDKYDWKSMMAIRRGDDHDVADAAGLDLEELPGGHTETNVEFEAEQKNLERASKISKTATVVMVRLHPDLIQPGLRTPTDNSLY
jgi:Na+/proline symporter